MASKDYSNILKRIEEMSKTPGVPNLYKSVMEDLDIHYQNYKEYLDPYYRQQLKKFDTRSRIWEIRLVDYFKKNSAIELQKYSIEQVDNSKDLKLPDFFFKHKDCLFYVEAIAVSPGEKCESLKETISAELKVLDVAQKTKDAINRIKNAIKIKMKDYRVLNGYKNVIKNNGFIIAISLCKVDFPNLSPSRIDSSLSELGDFINKYPELSGVILSYTWEGLFPDITKDFGIANWPEHCEDYPVVPHPGDIRILYNSHASINLPRKLLPAIQHNETIISKNY